MRDDDNCNLYTLLMECALWPRNNDSVVISEHVGGRIGCLACIMHGFTNPRSVSTKVLSISCDGIMTHDIMCCVQMPMQIIHHISPTKDSTLRIKRRTKSKEYSYLSSLHYGHCLGGNNTMSLIRDKCLWVFIFIQHWSLESCLWLFFSYSITDPDI